MQHVVQELYENIPTKGIQITTDLILVNCLAGVDKALANLLALREHQTSVEVLREQKRGLEKKVQVLEELKTKVVKLEAEVEAGRRERNDLILPLSS